MVIRQPGAGDPQIAPEDAAPEGQDGAATAARKANGNRQRGGRSGWIRRRGAPAPDLPAE